MHSNGTYEHWQKEDLIFILTYDEWAPSRVWQYKCHTYFPSPFWRTFRHMVDFTFGMWSRYGCSLQSVIGSVELSNGSAHFGSLSERHTQHLMPSTVDKERKKNIRVRKNSLSSKNNLVCTKRKRKKKRFHCDSKNWL